jgi:sorting nexin-1/2
MNAREHFSVGTPSLLKDKYVVYFTKGVDQKGFRWEANRRYNEFFSLREKLATSWPGLYIPWIPGKKLLGNRDVKFIVERRYFLERFYMQMSRFEYLLYGQEWQIFCRPSDKPKDGDIT